MSERDREVENAKLAEDRVALLEDALREIIAVGDGDQIDLTKESYAIAYEIAVAVLPEFNAPALAAAGTPQTSGLVAADAAPSSEESGPVAPPGAAEEQTDDCPVPHRWGRIPEGGVIRCMVCGAALDTTNQGLCPGAAEPTT